MKGTATTASQAETEVVAKDSPSPDQSITDVNVTDTEGEVVDTFEVIEIEEGGLGLYEFELPGVGPVILKEPTGKDVNGFQQANMKKPMSPLAFTFFMVSKMCVKWGDSDKVSPQWYSTLGLRKLKPVERRLGAFFAHYFPA